MRVGNFLNNSYFFMSHIVIRQKLDFVRIWNFLILSAHFLSIAEIFFMSFEQKHCRNR